MKLIISIGNQPDFIAICISFNLRHFLGQLVEFEECYNNFSEPNFQISSDKKVDFFSSSWFKFTVIPDVITKYQSTFKATCVSFNFKHFSCQLVKPKECYSNFSDFN